MEKSMIINSQETVQEIFGQLDRNVRLIEEKFHVQIFSRSGELVIKGRDTDVESAGRVIKLIAQTLSRGGSIDDQKLDYYMNVDDEDDFVELDESVIVYTAKGAPVRPKTAGQKNYIQSVMNHDVVIAIGPAGTGKTFLAVALAVRAFKNREVSRIVITRPAVEAGEKLGFLPGDLQMKIDPYLRPIYDALHEILGSETFMKLKERGQIEIAPLAYMRGRTLDDCYVILDEAQNTTPQQMKMLLTRFGFGSKVIVNGDITQVDLPSGTVSGLANAVKVLKDIKEIGIVKFSENDVVRHKLVKKIITNYERYEQKRREKDGAHHRKYPRGYSSK